MLHAAKRLVNTLYVSRSSKIKVSIERVAIQLLAHCCSAPGTGDMCSCYTCTPPSMRAPDGEFLMPLIRCHTPPPTAPMPNAPPTSSMMRSGQGSRRWSTDGPAPPCPGSMTSQAYEAFLVRQCRQSTPATQSRSSRVRTVATQCLVRQAGHQLPTAFERDRAVVCQCRHTKQQLEQPLTTWLRSAWTCQVVKETHAQYIAQ